MTSEEFIELAKTCRNRTELLNKLGGYENTGRNRGKYIAPLRRLSGMTPQELTDLFIKDPAPTPTPSSV